MRYFTFAGPYSINGYAEIPMSAPADYMNPIYKDIDVWGRLTFGGIAKINSDGNICDLYSEPFSLPLENNPEHIHGDWDLYNELLNSGDWIKVVGFDDNHIERFYGDIDEEAERLAKQIDVIFNLT